VKNTIIGLNATIQKNIAKELINTARRPVIITFLASNIKSSENF
jgi:hypothetical protein